jgi:thiosulfate reductase cytochrome b subunit
MAEIGKLPTGVSAREDVAPPAPIHPLYVRITHWINALAILAMIGSGWQIYNASPLFSFAFPRVVGLASGLLVHFAFMWLLVVNGLVYLILGLLKGHFRRRLQPIKAGEIVRELRAAATGRLRHDPARYNSVQKLLYCAILVTGFVAVASGLALWKPVQLWQLAALFGGYESARRVHFFAMAVIVLFLVVHIVMASLVPQSLRAMIRGR